MHGGPGPSGHAPLASPGHLTTHVWAVACQPTRRRPKYRVSARPSRQPSSTTTSSMPGGRALRQ
eukprot:1367649-Lingulodinium_polyedra.AAC.1